MRVSVKVLLNRDIAEKVNSVLSTILNKHLTLVKGKENWIGWQITSKLLVLVPIETKPSILVSDFFYFTFLYFFFALLIKFVQIVQKLSKKVAKYFLLKCFQSTVLVFSLKNNDCLLMIIRILSVIRNFSYIFSDFLSDNNSRLNWELLENIHKNPLKNQKQIYMFIILLLKWLFEVDFIYFYLSYYWVL